jgi:uncharacterized protein (DUF927 family)
VPDANIDPVSPVVVPPAEPVGGVTDEGSHIDSADELDARRQPSPDADGNPTSGRDDHPRHAPEGDGAEGKPQVDPPEYRSFGDFKMTEDGLVAPVGPQQVRTRICAPFEVIGRARDPLGNGWGKLIRWTDEDKRLRTHLVPDADLHREVSALTARLADMGLHVTLGCGRPLAEYLSQVEVKQRLTCVSRTGWHEIGGAKCFILPHRNVAVPTGEKVLLNVGSAAKFEIAGTLDDWQRGVGQLVRDHSRAVVAVSAAFVGPLLALLNQEGGGVHFYGRSSIGKTTILAAAASVWGRGATSGGFVRSWRATANALEAEAAMHSDVALVLDEMGVVDAREAGSAVYQLAMGAGKGRARRDGLLRERTSWRAVVISSGEIRLADKLAEDRRRSTAGHAIRLLDIPADAGKGFGCFDHGGGNSSAKEVADQILAAATTSYGTAGPAFVEEILKVGINEIVATARELLNRFHALVVPSGADSQVLRAADRFGLIAVAGELTAALGVVPWPEGTALSAAEPCFRDWLAARGGVDPHEVITGIAHVRRFIEANGDSRFHRNGDGEVDIRSIVNRAGYTRGSGASREWLVLPEIWKEICQGYDPIALARALAERGMLRPDDDGRRLSRSVKIEGESRRAYVLTSTLLSKIDV